jgi:hypothetical protein
MSTKKPTPRKTAAKKPAAKKPIRTADVLKKFSRSGLARDLGISRAAVQHWGDFLPQAQALKLETLHPNWRRRPDFDLEAAVLGGRKA